jgi:hypothetical protein
MAAVQLCPNHLVMEGSNAVLMAFATCRIYRCGTRGSWRTRVLLDEIVRCEALLIQINERPSQER